MENPHLSIIIPAYRSSEVLEKNLPYLMNWVKGNGKVTEVIIVDDGSGDNGGTKRVADLNGAIYLGYDVNRGKGGAVRFGMQHAKGSICVFTDSDIPFDTKGIELILHYLEELEYHLAIGDRGLAESDYFGRISGKRRFGSGFFTFLVGRFVTTGFSDTQCGLKGFKREVAKDLFSVSRINGFAFDVELVYIALKRNYDIKKIPVILRSLDGNSVSVLRHGWKMVFDLFRIKINHMKGYYNKK